MRQPKIYLAGPAVFFPNSLEIGENLKKMCTYHGYTGLYPLDNCISENTPEKTAHAIVQANMNMIKECDFVLANLCNFRGSRLNPQCDSGTAWECGYAIALGKTVIGYTNNKNSIPQVIVDNINLTLTIHQFEDIFDYLNTVIFQTSKIDFTLPFTVPLDMIADDIEDANAISAFILGYKCGKKLPCSATLNDFRSQVEKYGTIDKYGYTVENFGFPVNIMIACNAKIKNPNNPDEE